jgi:hypothetical protein
MTTRRVPFWITNDVQQEHWIRIVLSEMQNQQQYDIERADRCSVCKCSLTETLPIYCYHLFGDKTQNNTLFLWVQMWVQKLINNMRIIIADNRRKGKCVWEENEHLLEMLAILSQIYGGCCSWGCKELQRSAWRTVGDQKHVRTQDNHHRTISFAHVCLSPSPSSSSTLSTSAQRVG